MQDVYAIHEQVIDVFILRLLTPPSIPLLSFFSFPFYRRLLSSLYLSGTGHYTSRPVLATHGGSAVPHNHGGYSSPYESDPDHASIDINPNMHEPVTTSAFESKVSQLQRKHSGGSNASRGGSHQPVRVR